MSQKKSATERIDVHCPRNRQQLSSYSTARNRGRVLVTLVRLVGDLDLAEESMHEALAAALHFFESFRKIIAEHRQATF
jgi:hypothetical protein